MGAHGLWPASCRRGRVDCDKNPPCQSIGATEKLPWVSELMPASVKRTIITHHKGNLSPSPDDVLIDDRPHKASIHGFEGLVIPILSASCPSWKEAPAWLLEYLTPSTPEARRFSVSVWVSANALNIYKNQPKELVFAYGWRRITVRVSD